MAWLLAFAKRILKYLSSLLLWVPRQLRLVVEEKKGAEREVTVWFEKYRISLKQQLDKEASPEKKQALEKELEGLIAAQTGYYMKMLERTLERSGLPPYGHLVSTGERVLEPENKAKITEALAHLHVLPPPPTADDFMASATANYALGQYEEALANLNQALQLRPDYPAALNNRGATYDALERYDEALADYNRALELRPDFPEALNNRGNVYLGIERFENAVDAYNRVLQIKPDDLNALNNRGVTYMKLKRYKEALTDFKRIFELRANDPSALYNMACLSSLTHKTDDAISCLEKAIGLEEKYREKARTDTDFDNIRDDPRFRRLVEGD